MTRLSAEDVWRRAHDDRSFSARLWDDPESVLRELGVEQDVLEEVSNAVAEARASKAESKRHLEAVIRSMAAVDRGSEVLAHADDERLTSLATSAQVMAPILVRQHRDRVIPWVRSLRDSLVARCRAGADERVFDAARAVDDLYSRISD